MATLKHSESRLSNSHISSNNSKWLQEELTDMDAKFEAMKKLLKPQADDFARRADLFFRQRPQILGMVEEVHQAYHGLAGRYDHATRELRQANGLAVGPDDDSGTPSQSHSGKRSRAHSDRPEPLTNRKGLKQLHDIFGSVEGTDHVIARKDQNSHDEDKAHGSQNGVTGQAQVVSEYEQVGKSEDEVQILKQAIARLEAEKEASLLQYQQSLEKLSTIKNELDQAQKEAGELNERASRAEKEAESLKHALSNLVAEKEAGAANYLQCLERISDLETAQKEAGRLDERASKAEKEVETLKQSLSKLEAENEASLLRYKQCLEKISDLETKLSYAEEEARKRNEKRDKAEAEVQSLREIITKLNEANEAATIQYQHCLETISELETKITRAHEETTRLNNELAMGVKKFNSAEEQHHMLERAYQSLKSEADTLMQKMGMLITHELVQKDEELVNLRAQMQEEHMHLIQAEDALINLQELHYKSQDEQRDLEMELEDRFQMLEEMKLQNQYLEDEIQQLKEENKNLNVQNVSSTMSIKNLQEEVLGLKETIEKVKEESELRLDQRNALQQEIYCLKEEINELNRRHQSVIEQVESVGFEPDSLGSSIKNLQDEQSKLREINQNERDEKDSLLEKLEHMEKLLEKIALLENSLSDVNVELEELREKLKTLEATRESLQQEKTVLVAEKASLVSQLETIKEDLGMLSEKNMLLENSLADVNVELESSRVASKNLEESFQAVNNEKSSLLSERDSMVTKLESVQEKLEDVEKCYKELGEKDSYLEKEKESILDQVAELQTSLAHEREKHASFLRSNETHVASLEEKILVLQEEHLTMKRDFEAEQDKAMKAQIEFFIWERCVRDVEERNFFLLIENQKHIETSKLSEKLILELEQKNVEQQSEVKSLSNQVNKQRMGIHHVLRSLGNDLDYECQDKKEEEERLIQHIVKKIENMGNELVETQDEKQQLVFEKSVLTTLLEQLTSDMQESRLILQNENFKLLQESEFFMMEVSNLKDRNSKLEEENSVMIEEVMVLSNLFFMLKSFRAEKAAEVKGLGESLDYLHEINGGLGKEIRIMREGMDKLENELYAVRNEHDQLNHEVEIRKELLTKKEMELSYLQQIFDIIESEKLDLHLKIEEYKMKEENLCTELKENRNESESLEAEAEKLYNDREISTTRAIVLEEKLYGLIGAFEKLEDKSATQIEKIEHLKESRHILEGEIGEMKYEIAKYSNDVVPLMKSIKSLEELVFSEMTELEGNHEMEDLGPTKHLHDSSSEELCENCNHVVSNGVADLLDLESRLKAVEKTLMEMKKLKMQEKMETDIKLESAMKAVEDSKSYRVGYEEIKTGKNIVVEPIEVKLAGDHEDLDAPKSKDIMPDPSAASSSSYDPELAQHLKSDRTWLNDQSEANIIDNNEGQKSEYNKSFAPDDEEELVVDKLEVSKSTTREDQEASTKKVLERLSSDSKKLTNLNITVQGLKSKVGQTPKTRRADNYEYDMVDGQLQEIENAIIRLLDINGTLRDNIEIPLSHKGKAEMESEEGINIRRRKVFEQTERLSEKIGKLVLEVQRIQLVLSKLEVEHATERSPGVNGGRKRVLLKDYFYGDRKTSSTRRRKRDRFCLCVRPSTVEED